MLKNIVFAAALAAVFIPSVSLAATPKASYGKLLVSTSDSRDAWYVNPKDGVATYFADPQTALKAFPGFALGINNQNLFGIARAEDNSAPTNPVLAKRLAGYFLLQVEDHGQLWYVHPTTYKRYYVGSTSDVLALYKAAGLISDTKAQQALTTSPTYKTAANILKQAHVLMSGETRPFKNPGESKIFEGAMTRYANDKTVVYRLSLWVSLPSGLLGFPYGPLAPGTYYLTSNTNFFTGETYPASDEYLSLQGIDRSRQVLNAVFQLQTALEMYKAAIGAYPVSSQVVQLPENKEIMISKEHGFYGATDDKTIYARVTLPTIKNNAYLYISFDGSDYSFSYTLERDTGGFRAGRYLLSSTGVQDASS